MANATSEGETAPSKKAGAAPTSAKAPVKGEGTRASPWTLQTPSLSSEFVAFRDEQLASTLHQCFCYGLPTACLLMVLFPNPIALERSRASRCSPRASSKTRLPRTRSEIAATLSAPTGHPSSSRIGAPIAFMPCTILPCTNEKPLRRVSATIARSAVRPCPG